MKNGYEIRGEVTVIFLTKRDGTVLEATIDTEDLQRVIDYGVSWYAGWNSPTNSYYARGRLKSSVHGSRELVSLHRFIMDVPDGMVADHINHATLDNRKANLRVCTQAQNLQNQIKVRSDNSSGYRGVFWRNDAKKWRAIVELDGKKHFLGLYDDPKDAHSVVTEFRAKYMHHSQEAMEVIA